MTARVIADENVIRNYILRMMLTPYLNVYEGVVLHIHPLFEPGYEVWIEERMMFVITPKAGYTNQIRKEIEYAIS